MHPRKALRAAAVEIIRSAGTDAAHRVYNSRDFTLNTNSTPAIVVYTLGERIDSDQQHEGGLRRRVMDMRVECYHTGDDGADAVDEMAWQVETALRAAPTLGNLALTTRLINTDMAFAAQGEFALHAAVMHWEVTYYTHPEDDGADDAGV
jgi:hypothetical protein